MHKVHARTILSPTNGMNIYRGCQHGCIYCDSRSSCYNMNHAFEDIEVKENAPQLLEAALKAKRTRCMIGTGSMSDPYIPLERKLGLTRQCLEIINRYGFGAAVLTKSDLILRDIDLLDSINRQSKAVVQMTITTIRDDLCRIIEPRVCPTSRRFEVLCEMNKRGIPTVIWMCPLLPYLSDTEENVRGIVSLAKQAGCRGILSFGMGLTLRRGDREYFYAALDRHFPGLKQRYIRVFGDSYDLPARKNERLWQVFVEECEKAGLEWRSEDLFYYLHKFEDGNEQLTLF